MLAAAQRPPGRPAAAAAAAGMARAVGRAEWRDRAIERRWQLQRQRRRRLRECSTDRCVMCVVFCFVCGLDFECGGYCACDGWNKRRRTQRESGVQKWGGDDGVVVGVLGIGRRKREKVHAVSEKML